MNYAPLVTDVGVGIPNLRDELDEEDLLDVNDNDDSLSRPSSPIGLHSPPEDYARFRSLLPSTQPTPSTASTSYLYPDLLRWPSSTNIANSSIPVPVMDPSPYYGYTGVNNMGNTCYLGAVIQCLANTKELRDYFLCESMVMSDNLGAAIQLCCYYRDDIIFFVFVINWLIDWLIN